MRSTHTADIDVISPPLHLFHLISNIDARRPFPRSTLFSPKPMPLGAHNTRPHNRHNRHCEP